MLSCDEGDVNQEKVNVNLGNVTMQHASRFKRLLDLKEGKRYEVTVTI